ncbi:glycoside hydrolase [Aureobasidium pullulans]|nr:glycoside hydrolase [Aureobasidium pullulans]
MRVAQIYTALTPLILAREILAQNYTNVTTSAVPSSTTVNGTAVANPSAFVTKLQLSVEDLWDFFVGPVDTANTTTTIEATPVPSSSLIPPPFIGSYGFPPGRQVPLVTKNESWSFPKDFYLGVAGASFQIEGAARADGKGPSTWDVNMHRVPGFATDNSTGDITDNNYYMYKQDIARLSAMGINAYSFSIAWTRLFPFGTGPVNELGIAHYNDIIDTCIQYNITPMATLYHWDMPALLQNQYGGWLSEQIIGDFTEYARIAYSRFGDRVKHWFTINEPIVICTSQYPMPAGYWRNFSIPNIEQPFVCGRNILLAHAEAYRLGKSIIPDSSITFKNNGGYKVPLTNSSADAEAVQRAWDFNEGWFADPVYLTGDWPSTVNDHVSSFLPPFTSQQKQLILGSADFFAHDAYTAQFYMAPDAGIESCVANASNPLYPSCANSSYTYGPAQGNWAIGPAADSHSPWLHRATDWFPAFMSYINTTWPSPHIQITEFGFAEPFESSKTLLQDILWDPIRTSYYHDYMEAILISLSEGIKITAALAWSFVDNLEWNSGFSVRFGLQYVNFTDSTLERHYKASFFEYTNMYQTYVEK